MQGHLPIGSDQPGWSAIDLRPDGGATLNGGGLNACLLYLPIPSADPALTLVAMSPQDILGAATKHAINVKLGTSLSASRFDLIVAELLLTPPSASWKPLAATVSNQYEIWLNGLLYSQSSITGGSSFSENWDCANSASITCQLTWTKLDATALQISSNLINTSATSTSWNLGRAENNLRTADHSASVQVVTLVPAGGGDVTAMTGTRKDSTATLTYYHGDVNIADGNTVADHRLWKRVAGTFTQLGANNPTDFTANEVLKTTANGSTITVAKNDTTLITQTDTAITGNLRALVGLFRSITAMDVSADNWLAVDVSESAPDFGRLSRVRLRQY